MTGGRVVLLGRSGRNFAAGMSGGLAFVYDADRVFKARCNTESVTLIDMESENEYANWLATLIKTFFDETGSLVITLSHKISKFAKGNCLFLAQIYSRSQINALKMTTFNDCFLLIRFRSLVKFLDTGIRKSPILFLSSPMITARLYGR